MGWIRGLAPVKLVARRPPEIETVSLKRQPSVEQVEDISSTPEVQSALPQHQVSISATTYHFQPTKISDEDLPFIPKEAVLSKRRPGALSGEQTPANEEKNYWIVVDDVVYDCTSFIHEHPGGEQVILSFVGEDCSWQFWRFHGKNEMEQYGKELRIGRTKGIKNRFAEPVRFVGLSKFGNDDW